MIVRHAHDLANAPEHHHLVTPFTILMVIVAAYFSIPDWYMAQVINLLHDYGARLLGVPSMMWNYARLNIVVPMARMARDSGSFVHSFRKL